MNTPAFIAFTSLPQGRPARRGFTLVEILVATTLCLFVVGMALPALVSGLVLSAKSMSTVKVADDLRLSAEHMSTQLGTSMRTPVLSKLNSTGTQAARVTYRSSVGIPGKALATSKLSQTLEVSVDGTCHPEVGDSVTISGLNVGDGILITQVKDGRTALTAGSSAVITLTFAEAIQNSVTGTPSDIKKGQSISIFRDAAYEVVSVKGENQLAWFRHASDTAPTSIVTRRLSALSAAPFTLVDGQLNFELVAENTGDVPASVASGQRRAYTRAGLKGQLMSKSGNPFALNNPSPKKNYQISSYNDIESSGEKTKSTKSSGSSSSTSSTPTKTDPTLPVVVASNSPAGTPPSSSTKTGTTGSTTSSSATTTTSKVSTDIAADF